MLEELEAFGARGIAWSKKRVAVIVPDATRPFDARSTLAPLLSFLARKGAKSSVIVALGLHRPMTAEESAELRVLSAAFSAPLIEHRAADPGALRECGAAIPAYEDGRGPMLPKVFARAAVESDLIFVTGIVEPHQYAGYSGGAKSVVIGCGSKETISGMHGLHFLRDPAVQLGEAEKNPFQRAIARLAQDLPEMFALQIVPGTAGPRGGPYVSVGPWIEAYTAARKVAAATMFDPVAEPLDYAVLSVPAAKAKSFYQASRAATYVALIDRPAVRSGGLLVVDAACPEGIGEGDGERACRAAMMRGREVLLEELAGIRPAANGGGAQRAYLLARTLARNTLILSGCKEELPELAAMGIRQVRSLSELTFVGKGQYFADPFLKVPRLSE